MVEGKGRGVFCDIDIPQKTFLCEYKKYRIYPASSQTKFEAMYDANDEGSCIMSGTADRRLCFDATRRLDQVMF